jgi:hypothetical protein
MLRFCFIKTSLRISERKTLENGPSPRLEPNGGGWLAQVQRIIENGR